MKKLSFLAVVVALSITCISPPHPLAAPALPEDKWLNGAAGYARALELQRELKVPLVVYFYADWCPYCQTLDSRYLPAAEVQDYLRSVVKVRINPEHGPAERELAVRYGVSGYPAFFVVQRAAAQPVKVHPFKQRGNLTPAQFALECRSAAPVSVKTTGLNSSTSRSPERSTEGTVTRQERAGVQIITVKPAATASPNFISDGALPTLDAVLERYVQALGGRAAQMRLTSRVTKGRVDVPGVSDGGRLEVYAKAPNKSLTVMSIDTMGVIRQGFDGRVGWEQSDQRGVRGSTGETLSSLARDAEFYGALKLKELYARIKLLGKVKEGFHQTYLVEATPRAGNAEMFYFDAETGLLVRHDVTRPTSKGSERAEVYLNDWREVDGVKIPFRLTQSMPDVTFVFTVEEVKHNVPVEEAIFNKPSR